MNKVVFLFRPKLLEDFGEQDILKAAIVAPRAYRIGTATQPPDDLIVMQLAMGGISASGEGGVSAFSFERRRRRAPATRDIQEFIGRISRFITVQPGATIDVADLQRLEYFVRLGLEAYGLTRPTNKVGLPARRYASESVRTALAFHDRQLRTGRTTKRQILMQLARQRQGDPRVWRRRALTIGSLTQSSRTSKRPVPSQGKCHRMKSPAGEITSQG